MKNDGGCRRIARFLKSRESYMRSREGELEEDQCRCDDDRQMKTNVLVVFAPITTPRGTLKENSAVNLHVLHAKSDGCAAKLLGYRGQLH